MKEINPPAIVAKAEADLQSLAAWITQHHSAARQFVKMAAGEARAAGAWLLVAKGKLPHGRWLPWLRENVEGLSERTAQDYMRLAEGWPKLQSNPQHAADLSVRECLQRLRQIEELEEAEAAQPNAASPRPAEEPVRTVTVVRAPDPEPQEPVRTVTVMREAAEAPRTVTVTVMREPAPPAPPTQPPPPERMPGDDTDVIEEELREERARPKNGAVLFDKRGFESDFGKLFRHVDAVGNAYGRGPGGRPRKDSPRAEGLRKRLEDFKAELEDWVEELQAGG